MHHAPHGVVGIDAEMGHRDHPDEAAMSNPDDET
jgi:hypothetical protein